MHTVVESFVYSCGRTLYCWRRCVVQNDKTRWNRNITTGTIKYLFVSTRCVCGVHKAHFCFTFLTSSTVNKLHHVCTIQLLGTVCFVLYIYIHCVLHTKSPCGSKRHLEILNCLFVVKKITHLSRCFSIERMRSYAQSYKLCFWEYYCGFLRWRQ